MGGENKRPQGFGPGTAVVGGTVSRRAAAPGPLIFGATLTFVSEDDTQRHTVVAKQGRYSVELPLGWYKVLVTHPEYHSEESGILVNTRRGRSTCNVFLAPKK